MTELLTTEQYRVLCALRDRRPCTLRAMMRRGFLRRKWIEPVRGYPVTALGLVKLEEYEAARASAETPCLT